MKVRIHVFVSIAMLLACGCNLRLGGATGLNIAGPKPPPNAYVRITGRSIGINIGQNAATQQPEIVLGFKSVTYDRVPTSAGTNVFIAPVRATINVTGGFSAGVNESLETGTK